MENNIYTKLFEVKKAGIKLQRDTKAFNYKYATLQQIQEKLGDVLQEQKLVIFHRIEQSIVITRIQDIETDDYIESGIQLTDGIKAQDKGSEITYYRRYNLLSLLDLEVEDDDGAKASGRTEQTNKTNKEIEDNKPWFNDPELENFKKVKDEYTKETAVQVAREKYKVSREFASKIEGLYN